MKTAAFIAVLSAGLLTGPVSAQWNNPSAQWGGYNAPAAPMPSPSSSWPNSSSRSDWRCSSYTASAWDRQLAGCDRYNTIPGLDPNTGNSSIMRRNSRGETYTRGSDGEWKRNRAYD